MNISKLKCFGINDKSGNIAYVIDNDSFDDNGRQSFAKDMNVSVCVFINNILNDTVKVSFFYPDKQSPLCLHGILALAKVFFTRYTTVHKFVVENIAGKKVFVSLDNDKIYLELSPEYIRSGDVHLLDVMPLLGITNEYVVGLPVVSSVGSPKLLLEISSKEKLFALTPDLKLIDLWSKRLLINGICVYYINNDKELTIRNFNHLYSDLEDSATGVAALALCFYLKQNIIVSQGSNLGNYCELKTIFCGDKVLLTGNVNFF